MNRDGGLSHFFDPLLKNLTPRKVNTPSNMKTSTSSDHVSKGFQKWINNINTALRKSCQSTKLSAKNGSFPLGLAN